MSSASSPPFRPPAGVNVCCDSVSVGLHTDDDEAAAWLLEVLQPWFRPDPRPASWRLSLARAGAATHPVPPDAEPRGCFAFDQQVLSLHAWGDGQAVIVDDPERSCRMAFAPFHVTVSGDPATRRWRMNGLWSCCEIAACHLRRDHLDLHAAALAHRGRALLIAGPKGAGKTTLLTQLLKALGGHLVTNDRAFVRPQGAGFEARGMPTAVKLRPDTLRAYPELARDLTAVARPYLYTLKELAARAGEVAEPAAEFFALSPAQFAHRLGVRTQATAPLAALVLPWVDTSAGGWSAERLTPPAVGQALRATRYGQAGPRRRTVIEELVGPAHMPDGREDALAASVPAFRVRLGRDVYREPDFAARFTEQVLA